MTTEAKMAADERAKIEALAAGITRTVHPSRCETGRVEDFPTDSWGRPQWNEHYFTRIEIARGPGSFAWIDYPSPAVPRLRGGDHREIEPDPLLRRMPEETQGRSPKE